MTKAQIDWERAEIICGQLLAARARGQYPYSRAPLPQTQIPEVITRDDLVHSRFLFGTCHYMRGTIKSYYAFKILIQLFLKEPRLFDPFEASQMELSVIRKHLHEMIPYQSNQIGFSWLENAKRLAEHWDGDPRNIFLGVEKSDEMYGRITNKKVKGKRPDGDNSPQWGFLGFQKKMASMLAYFLMDARLIHDIIVSPPVDFHLTRVMIATGILKVDLEAETKYRYEHLSPLGIEVLEQYCHSHQVRMVELADAMWILSGVLCARAPGNESEGRSKGKDRNTKPTPAIIDWHSGETINRYARSCGTCPVESHCSINVLSGVYYEDGAFCMLPRERPFLLFPSLPGQVRST